MHVPTDPAEHLSQAFRDPQAEGNVLGNALVRRYQQEMEAAVAQLVGVQKENALLRTEVRNLQKRNADLERELQLLRRGVGGSAAGVAATAGGAGAASAAEAPAAAPPAAAVAPVTPEERTRLATYITEIANSGDDNLAQQLMLVLQVRACVRACVVGVCVMATTTVCCARAFPSSSTCAHSLSRLPPFLCSNTPRAP